MSWGTAVGAVRARGVRGVVSPGCARPRPHGEADRGRRPESDEGQALIKRLFALLKVDLLLWFAIVFAMTVKPTGDDTAVVIVAAAVLVAGAAFFLDKARVASA